MRFYAAAFAAVMSAFSIETGALAQDAADAAKFSAKLFTVDVNAYGPAQVLDFVQVYMRANYDSPQNRWQPLETRVRTEDKLKLTALSRGGSWLPTGNSIEFNFFAEKSGAGTRLTHYLTVIQNTGSSLEQRYDITRAAAMYRVSKGLHEDAEKRYMPSIGQTLAAVAGLRGAPPLKAPSRAFYVSPSRDDLLNRAEQTYVDGDAAGAMILLRNPPLSERPAALARISYMLARGEGAPVDQNMSNELLVRAAQAGDPVAAGNRDFFGIDAPADARLGYGILFFAAQSGNLDAMFSIASLHERGWPAPDQFIGEAYRLYFIAGELGHIVAKAKAAQLAAKVSDEVRSRATADAEAWKKFATPRKS